MTKHTKPRKDNIKKQSGKEFKNQLHTIEEQVEVSESKGHITCTREFVIRRNFGMLFDDDDE